MPRKKKAETDKDKVLKTHLVNSLMTTAMSAYSNGVKMTHFAEWLNHMIEDSVITFDEAMQIAQEAGCGSKIRNNTGWLD